MESDGSPATISNSMIGLLIVAVILIILSATFSASESAFFSLNKLRLRLLRNKGDKKAIRAGKLLDKKEKLLNSILVGNNVVNIVLSSIVTSICLELFGQSGMGYATIGVTIVLLIFGEIIPKTLATHFPEKIAFFFAPFIKAVTVILNPIVFVLIKCVRFIAKVFHINIEEKKVSFTEEDIKQYIQVGEEEGLLEHGEKQMMNRVFKFTDLSAFDIMTPRTKIRAVNINISYRELMELYQKTKYSYFPVYGKDLDDIKGILHMKDLLFTKTCEKDFDIKNLMRKPFFILESKNMTSIQQMLDENRENIAIVIDEYSGTSGLLTKKDIAEEIFGKIDDEFASSYTPEIQKVGENEIEIAGSIRLDEINDLFGLDLTSQNYETINGYLTEKFDGFPSVDAEIDLKGCKIRVIEANERKINKVLLILNNQESEEKL
ncbi:MAG: hemolysin family protein [Treponemataceae bacterium]|nr:hemolysin family protein [Treponemataceae bacterium]